jgi:alcohol dehydrogenase, propanol-preferring
MLLFDACCIRLSPARPYWLRLPKHDTAAVATGSVRRPRAMSGLPERMRAWQVTRPGPLDESPLDSVELRVPTPAPDEILVRVSACGVCRTDLHVVVGDLPTHRSPVTPGHEIVGRVVMNGDRAARFELGDRVGIAWLRHTCSNCRFCTTRSRKPLPRTPVHRMGR